jgi:hypothetical protein
MNKNADIAWLRPAAPLFQSVNGFTTMAKRNYLSAQLRESAPYLKDAGWRDTAALMIAAADEIEALKERNAELEADSAPIPIARTK